MAEFSIDQYILSNDFDREKLTTSLLDFALSDTLFFLSDNPELFEKQKELWMPAISWTSDFLQTKIEYTTTFDVPAQTEVFLSNLQHKISILSDKDFMILYSSALHMRSVLLALAFVNRKCKAKEVFEMSFLEEIWQASLWGVVEEAEERRNQTLAELRVLEELLNE